MQAILGLVDAALARGQMTYVHCWGGRGRTGTVVGCYLARHGIALGDEALSRIVHLRRREAARDRDSPETEAQCAMVRGWRKGK
jgi:protein-tyrosine phosphatase